MTRPACPSLARAPFQAALIIIITMAVLFSLLWGGSEYHRYQASIEAIRNNFMARYRNRLREEVDDLLTQIEHQRRQAWDLLEQELRNRVQTGYTIASHIYRLYGKKYPPDELRTMVAEILRPIRWNETGGFYLAGGLDRQRIDLFADDPLREGQPLESLRDRENGPLAPALLRIMRGKKAGLFHCRLQSSNFTESHSQITIFVKYFKPFDWFLGAAAVDRAMEDVIRKKVLAQINQARFGKRGYLFCVSTDGTILTHPDPNLIGRAITGPGTGMGSYGKTLLAKARSQSKGGFLSHADQEQIPGSLSFFRAYPTWNWILVADIPLTAMQKAINRETRAHRHAFLINTITLLCLLSVAVLLLLTAASYHWRKIRHGLNLFTEFFREAAHTQVRIDTDNLVFAEFEELAGLANTMIDDREQKKRILERNELRLDTLLQLGKMKELPIQERYDFILGRIVQLTESRAGYIALIDRSRQRLTLCSLIDRDESRNAHRDASPPELPFLELNRAGQPGKVVSSGQPYLNNTPQPNDTPDQPYTKPTTRRLDVPLRENGQIVVVAGVCDSETDYTPSDTRQIILLIEGLWLQIRKTCAEKEMARLERQVIAISEAERNRIGRNLHDDLGSHLGGLNLYASALEHRVKKTQPELAARIIEMGGLIREAIDKTRQLSRGLYPVHVVEYGLEAAIEELFAEIRAITPAHCTLLFDHRIDPLPDNEATHLYYIIREAVFNAARHARPENIKVTIQRQENRLQVIIEDDGNGMDEPPSGRGLGRHSMPYRAKALGAELAVSSAVDQGTTITLSGDFFP